MTLFDELRAVAILDAFTDDQVAALAAAGREESYDAGARLFDEGRPADDWWLLLAGRIDLVRRIGHEEQTMATMAEPGQWAGGFRAWDEHGVYMGSARVMEPSRVFRLSAAELAAAGEVVVLEAGTRLFDEGRPADDWWVLLEGRIDLVRRIGHEEAVMVGTVSS